MASLNGNAGAEFERCAHEVEALTNLLESDSGSPEKREGWQQKIRWLGERMLVLQTQMTETGTDHDVHKRVVQRHALL